MVNVVEELVAGNVRVAALLISNIDEGMSGTRDILEALQPHTGNAYVIGITGAPGVGKSTLVNQMVYHLRKRNKTVGVLAVDPTSPFSGGAILGDRIRMARHCMDEGVFIRSLATRGHFGGLTQSTCSAIDVLDAMGKDNIIVETVGVGQDEIDIVKSAHTTVVVVIPGMGDDVQVVKAGILEAGEIFLINKSDREGARKTLTDLTMMIEINKKKYEDGAWKAAVLMAEAVFDKGVVELLDEIEEHERHENALSDDLKFQKKIDRAHAELTEMIKARLVEDVLECITNSEKFKEAVKWIKKAL